MNLNDKIRNERIKNNFSLEEFASLLGVCTQIVQEWELGTIVPSPRELSKISSTLNVSIDSFQEDTIDNFQNESEICNEKVDDNLNQVDNSLFSIKENYMKPNEMRSCKIWLIIGAVLTPLFVGGAYTRNAYKPESLYFLLLYLITIPLCCITISKLKKGKTRSEVKPWGIVSLFFVSLIGGILILSANFNTKIIKKNTEEQNSIISDDSLIYEKKYKELKEAIVNFEIYNENTFLQSIVLISRFLSTKNYKDSNEIYSKYIKIFDQKENNQN